MRRIAGGIAGWLVAVLPLLGVNIAGYANILDTQTAALAGAAALIGGILLGSLITGLIAGRSSATRAGGAIATLPAGLLAALLYVVSLIAVVGVAIRIEAAPAVVMEHPIRITGAIIFLGAMLLGIALLAGMLAGKRASQPAPEAHVSPRRPNASAPQTAARPPSAPQPRYEVDSGQVARSAYADEFNRDQRNAGTWNREQGQGSHGGYGRSGSSYDEWQPAPQRSGAPSRPPTRHPSGPSGGRSGRTGGRDDDWHDDRR